MQYSVLDSIGRKFIALIRLFILGVLVAPLLVTILLSLSKSFTFPPSGFTLGWYSNFLSRPEFIRGLSTSIALGASTVIVATALGSGLAFVLVRHTFMGAGLLKGLVLSPVSLPRIACGVSLFLFFVNLGVSGAFPELLALHVIITCPYVVSVLTASLSEVDESLEQASMNLGANRYQTFRRVTLPLIRPGLVAGAIFAFVVSFDEVTASTFLVDAHTTTYPVVLFSYMERGGLDPTVAAGTSILLVPLLILIFILDRYVGLGRALGIWRFS